MYVVPKKVYVYIYNEIMVCIYVALLNVCRVC